MNRLFWGILIICAVSVYACGWKDDSTELIKPEKMRVVLWEYLQIQHYAQEVLSKDSTLNDTFAFLQLRDSMFLRHQIDAQVFKKSMMYYRAHPDQFLPVLDSIVAIQQRTIQFKESKKMINLDFLKER
jgi:hypothetical protein